MSKLLSKLSDAPTRNFRIDSSRINTILLNIDDSLYLRDFYQNHKTNVNYIINVYEYIKSQIMFFLLKDYFSDRNIEVYKNSNNFISYCKRGRTSFMQVYDYFIDDMILIQFNLLTVDTSLITIIPSVPKSLLIEESAIDSLESLFNYKTNNVTSLVLVKQKVVYEYIDYLAYNLGNEDYASIPWLINNLRIESLKIKASDIIECLNHGNKLVVYCVAKNLLYCLARKLSIQICIDEREDSI